MPQDNSVPPLEEDASQQSNQGSDPASAESPESSPESSQAEADSPAMTIEQWLERLRSADRAFYNIMAMEVWSIAKSMDTLIPGFWSRFMQNRREAMHQFVLKKRQTAHPDPDPASDSPESAPADADIDSETLQPVDHDEDWKGDKPQA